MTILKYILLALLFVLLTGAAIVRVKPLDPATLHVDPELATPPIGRDYVLIREGGTQEPDAISAPKADVASELEEIILSTARTRKLAGDLAQSYATYETRSLLWAFPDVTSVKLIERDGQTQVLVLARQVYGVKDFGVNEARVQDWLGQLDAN